MIKCKHCGSEENYRTEKKANNLVAFCNNCGSYIKNLPYAEPSLYFGKYAKIPIKDYNIPEMINYLHWCRNNQDLWQKLSVNVKQAINLKLDGKV